MKINVLTHRFSELTSLFGRVEDLVVEDGEVEGKTQTDGMGGLHFRLGDFESLLNNKQTNRIKNCG
jgi:hypothetical protein